MCPVQIKLASVLATGLATLLAQSYESCPHLDGKAVGWKCSDLKNRWSCILLACAKYASIHLQNSCSCLAGYSGLATGTNLKSNPASLTWACACVCVHTHVYTHTHTHTHRTLEEPKSSGCCKACSECDYAQSTSLSPEGCHFPAAAGAQPQVAFHLGKNRQVPCKVWRSGIPCCICHLSSSLGGMTAVGD